MIEFFNWKFYFPDHLKVYIDQDSQRIAALTDVDDEIHITIEVVNGQLVFHPRWNINIIFVGEKEIRFTTNS